MDDKIEAAQERVQECSMLIRELLEEYNCSLDSHVGVIIRDNDFNYKEIL